jgi:hypothetical protein
MAFDYNEYMADVDEFISLVESEGYRLGYHDERRSTINFSPDDPWDIRGSFTHEDIIEEIAYEVFPDKWITEIKTIGRGEIIVKYTDLYM